MSGWDDIAFSGEVGRINPLAEPDVIRPTHACPEMLSDGKPIEHNTMSIDQCILRLKENNPCTRKCRVMKKFLSSREKKQRRKRNAGHNHVSKRKMRKKRSVS